MWGLSVGRFERLWKPGACQGKSGDHHPMEGVVGEYVATPPFRGPRGREHGSQGKVIVNCPALKSNTSSIPRTVWPGASWSGRVCAGSFPMIDSRGWDAARDTRTGP